MTSTESITRGRQAIGSAAREVVTGRDPGVRLNDFYEVYERADPDAARAEGGRCMNCGAAFCMPDSGYGAPGTVGCPISNKIPEWNELVRLGRWRDAYERLSQTNPFPEFTARICPAPCQDACIAGINDRPIQIKGIERAIIDRAFDAGWVRPTTPAHRTGKRISIVGSGPAGLAAAELLNRQGHAVTVYERSDRAGGLLMYGVPNMKLDKAVVDRRIGLLRGSGVGFVLNAEVGGNIDPHKLLVESDAVLLACGALRPRELDLPGRELGGIHQAMAYLTDSMRSLAKERPPTIDAADKHVVVIGAGDTGTDCLGTAMRQGATSVVNLARGNCPPIQRDEHHPWPMPAGTLQVEYAHAEGDAQQGEDPRAWRSPPVAFVGDGHGRVTGVTVRCPDRGERTLPADLVILSVGFTGHDSGELLGRMGLDDGSWSADPGSITTISRMNKLFIAGDMRRGPSLVVHAIAEGRAAASEIHAHLCAQSQ